MSMHVDHGYVGIGAGEVGAEARAILDATREKLGFVPDAVAKMACSPALFHAFRVAAEAFEASSLSLVERETVILVVARENGCDVCCTMHRGVLARAGHGEIARRILAREPLNPRLEALAGFVVELSRSRGDAAREPWEAFLAAGFDRAQALEVLIGVGAYTMSTYANRLTGGSLART